MFSCLMSASIYFIYRIKINEGEKFNIFDFIGPFALLAQRSAVIAIKYGYYSEIHMEIIYQIKIGDELMNFDQVNIVIFE